MSEILHWDLEAEAERSTESRRVLWTGEHSQLVTTTVPVGGEVGERTHPDHDQLLVFVSNGGAVVVEGEERLVAPGDVVAIPAGTRHNVVNVAPHPLFLATVYGPPGRAAGDGGRDEPSQG